MFSETFLLIFPTLPHLAQPLVRAQVARSMRKTALSWSQAPGCQLRRLPLNSVLLLTALCHSAGRLGRLRHRIAGAGRGGHADGDCL